MPEIMAGQSRSISVTRRHEQTISTETQRILDTPITEHLVRFVYEGATDSDPLAGEEDELRTSDGVPVHRLLDVNPELEEAPDKQD